MFRRRTRGAIGPGPQSAAENYVAHLGEAGHRQSGGGCGEPPPIAGHEGGFAPAS